MAKNDSTRTPDIKATIVGRTLTLAFSHGEEIRLHAETTAGAIQEQAMMHGFKQKLVDAAAISRNPDTGRTASIVDKYNAVLEVYNRLTVDGESVLPWRRWGSAQELV